MNKITAVIPVREGSTRIKNKNIKPFAGTTLLENKIKQLKDTKGIDEIIVSSDSEIMLETARSNGVTAKKRPVEYCDERTKTFNEVVEYIANNQVETDIMMWVPCVCPMVSSDRFSQAIQFFRQIEKGEIDADGVVSASLLKEFVFDEKGPVNFSVEKFVPSQKLPNWHIITNGFFIAKTSDMAKWKFVYGKKPFLCEINKYEAIDIDDEYDFKIAELIYKMISNSKK